MLAWKQGAFPISLGNARVRFEFCSKMLTFITLFLFVFPRQLEEDGIGGDSVEAVDTEQVL
jgi:hypothetical protein